MLECDFNIKSNFLLVAKEERIGFVNIEVKKTKTVQRRHLNALKETKLAVKREINRVKRPIRLLPKHIL